MRRADAMAPRLPSETPNTTAVRDPAVSVTAARSTTRWSMRDFTWAEHGEALMRRRKAGYYQYPPLRSTVG